MRLGWAYSIAITLGMGAWPALAAAPEATPSSHPAAATQRASVASNELLLYEEIPVVVGAAKHEQRPRDAPASVTVITAEEIELYGYRNLADILRAQRGFYLSSDGLNSFLGVRGFLRPGEWNARILVLIDGRPTREVIFNQTHLDQDMIVPVEMMKRVEIIRGPGSALYGSNAVFAVINIITRDGADVKNWAELKAQGGNKETGRGLAVVGKKFDNGLDVLVGGARFTSEGDEDIRYPGVHDVARNDGHMRNHDGEDAGAGFLKIGYKEFLFEADYNKREKDNRAATYLALWDDPGTMTERRDDFSVRWDHPVSDGQSLHVLAFYSEYEYKQFWGQEDEKAGRYTYWSTADSGWFGQDVHYDWQTSKHNRLIFGSEAMEAVRTLQKDYDNLNGTLLDIDDSTNWWALYAQDEYTPVEWLTLIGGLRMDAIERFDPLLNPRAAAIITATKADTIKLLYGRAFRAPNLYEMFYSSPGANAPNPDLKPEINDTYEAIWAHDCKNGWHSETGYYLWRMTDSLGDGVKEGALQTRNIGTTWAQGVEAELQKKWANGARIRMSGCFGRAQNEEGDRLTQSPDVVLALAGAVPVLNKRTFLAAESQMVGPMLSDTGESSNTTFITNIVLTSKNVWKGIDVQIGVYNLFGEAARIPHTSHWDQSQPWLRQPGTLAMLSLTYRF